MGQEIRIKLFNLKVTKKTELMKFFYLLRKKINDVNRRKKLYELFTDIVEDSKRRQEKKKDNS